MSLTSRFWSKVDRRGPDDCWLWKAGKNNFGYGMLFNGKPRGANDRGHMLAHRASYEIHHGPIPKTETYHGVCVLHTCDTPSCVNPAHLRLGSHAENMADRDAKGRANTPIGTRHRSSKLTEDQVLAIKNDGRARVVVAKNYGVSPSTVSQIVHGYTWKHLKESKNVRSS